MLLRVTNGSTVVLDEELKYVAPELAESSYTFGTRGQMSSATEMDLCLIDFTLPKRVSLKVRNPLDSSLTKASDAMGARWKILK